MTLHQELISNCCTAPIMVEGDTTKYYVCTDCWKACDAVKAHEYAPDNFDGACIKCDECGGDDAITDCPHCGIDLCDNCTFNHQCCE